MNIYQLQIQICILYIVNKDINRYKSHTSPKSVTILFIQTSIFLSSYLSFSLVIYLSIYLSIFLSSYLSFYIVIHLSINFLSFYLVIYLSIQLTIFLSSYLSFYLVICNFIKSTIFLSRYLYSYLTFYLSIFLPQLCRCTLPFFSNFHDKSVNSFFFSLSYTSFFSIILTYLISNYR